MAHGTIVFPGEYGTIKGSIVPATQNGIGNIMVLDCENPDGSSFNVDGLAVSAYFKDQNTKLEYVATGTLTATGTQITWEPSSEDVGLPSDYLLYFSVIIAGKALPSYMIEWAVKEVPFGVLVPPVGTVGLTPAEAAWVTASFALNPVPEAWLPGTYDAVTDTYSFKTTADGQTLNAGREIFMLMQNDNGAGATVLDPKVFVSIGTVVGDEQYQSAIPALASDIDDSKWYGINTTPAAEGQKFKATAFGQVNAINTSAWGVGDVLYISPSTRGEITNVKPFFNAHPVATVEKVGATDGVLSVNTIANTNADIATGALVSVYYWLTGDTVTPVATTFYRELEADQGTVASATQTVLVADNDKQPFTQDYLSDAYAADSAIIAGQYAADLEMTISVAGGNQKITIERYITDGNGVPIDSGILTEPIGDLGVRPLFVFKSPLLDMDGGAQTFIPLVAALASDFTVTAGQRWLDHILCEKIGVSGPTITFTLFFGSDHLSRTLGLAQVTTDNVVNTSTVVGTTATDALETLDALKASKVAAAVAANFPAFDASNPADIVDSGFNSTSFDATGSAAAVQANLTAHEGDLANPHQVTQTQVGLGNVDNTSDLNKPISTATQTALDDKVDKVPTAVVGNYGEFDAGGNLIDSGENAASFDPAGSAAAVETVYDLSDLLTVDAAITADGVTKFNIIEDALAVAVPGDTIQLSGICPIGSNVIAPGPIVVDATIDVPAGVKVWIRPGAILQNFSAFVNVELRFLGDGVNQSAIVCDGIFDIELLTFTSSILSIGGNGYYTSIVSIAAGTITVSGAWISSLVLTGGTFAVTNSTIVTLTEAGATLPDNSTNSIAGVGRGVAIDGDTIAGTIDFDSNLATNLVDRAAVVSATITGTTHTVTATDARLFRLTLSNSPTVTLAAGTDGDSYVIVIIQDGVGSRAITWANVDWGDGGIPIIKTGIGDYNYFSFIYNVVEARWDGFSGGGFA